MSDIGISGGLYLRSPETSGTDFPEVSVSPSGKGTSGSSGVPFPESPGTSGEVPLPRWWGNPGNLRNTP